MLYPDPGERRILGWSIRWVASLFAALLVATGHVPAPSGSNSDLPIAPKADVAAGAPANPAASHAASHAASDSEAHDDSAPSAESEQVQTAEVAAAVLAVLGATSLAEVEIVKEQTKPAPFTVAPVLLSVHDTRLAAEIAARAPTSVDAAGSLWTRAPPLA